MALWVISLSRLPQHQGVQGWPAIPKARRYSQLNRNRQKHHLKAPCRLGLLSPYKRAGQGSTKGRTEMEQKNKTRAGNKQPTDKPPDRATNKRSTSQATTFSSFFSLRLELDTLSRMLVTPTRAPRCKEIQTSPPRWT
jgi:hypothetical protein